MNLAVDARAATVLEQQAVRWVGEFIGYPATNGAFTSGGTISNMTALAAARERAVPKSRAAGLGGLSVAVYASAEVHYSITAPSSSSGSGATGSGTSRSTTSTGCARTCSPRRSTATSPTASRRSPSWPPPGTTLTGAIDPIAPIAEICEPRGIWFHVDGAYGLPAASVVPERFDGVERADSVSVDAHKWLYVPKACSVALVREPDALSEAFAHEEGYLPHQRHELHAADITLEYSRPLRALKLWLAFRAHGAEQFREAIRRNLAEAATAPPRGLGSPRLRDVRRAAAAPSIVPIRHVPPGVEDLDAHNQALADAIQADGRVYLASALIEARSGSGRAS